MEKQKITLSQYQDELEQYIINNDAELNNVDKLEIICHTLDIQTTYVIIRDAADIQLSMFELLNIRFNEFINNN